MAPSETQLPFILKKRQFPVLLSFAMTIYKSQGQSFDKVGVYLHSPVFVHIQLYVALSRVRYANGLRVYVADNADQGKHEDDKVYTRNVVYNRYWNEWENKFIDFITIEQLVERNDIMLM